jgi:polyisoprenyl-phosphate glycosyltransferase
MVKEQPSSQPVISIVTPAYNEAENLPVLWERLSKVMGALSGEWEWIVVDDHSADETFAAVANLRNCHSNIKAVRFARNFGSHAAISCGLHRAQGECVVIIAADLQDPPETICELMEKWRGGAQVVWAVRGQREGETTSTLSFSRAYYFIMRHFVGLKEMSSTGADFFLIDRLVVDALKEFNESNASLFSLITWMGFRQASITYDKQARLHGRSGWNLNKKLKLLVDSITSFTYLPIRLMSYVGCIVAMLGFLYAAFIVVHALAGNVVQGWSSLMVVVLIVGGIQMLMMGVLGEYLWRALDESRRRPRYLIEATTDSQSDDRCSPGVLGSIRPPHREPPMYHDEATASIILKSHSGK